MYNVTVGETTKTERGLFASVTFTLEGRDPVTQPIPYDGTEATLRRGCDAFVRAIESKMAIETAPMVAEGTTFDITRPQIKPPEPSERDVRIAECLAAVRAIELRRARDMVYADLPFELMKAVDELELRDRLPARGY